MTETTAAALLATARAGDRITIENRHGQRQTGRVVMQGPAGPVLNLGGRYGTPGVATPDNFVSLRRGRRDRDSALMTALLSDRTAA